MKKLYLCFLVFYTIVVQAQTPNYCIQSRFAENDLFSSIAIASDIGVQYGSAMAYGNILDTLTMDIYYPQQSIDPLAQRPLVILVHGGGFTAGDKTDFTSYAEQLARRGYVAATLDYRLGWNSIGTGFPCTGNTTELNLAMYRALQDVKAGIRYLSFHANAYGIDKNTIFLAGTSAGAYTVMEAAFMDQQEANLAFPDAYQLLGPIDSSSNTFYSNFNIAGVFNWCGGVVDTAIIDANEDIPVLSIHGLLDNIAPVDTGTFLFCYNALNPYPHVYGPMAIYKRMTNLGLCVESNYDAAGMHCIYPSLDYVNYIPSKFTCFFKKILCNQCSTDSKVGYNSSTCMDLYPNEVQNLSLSDVVSIFPNPATDVLYINAKNATAYQVLNIEGKVILEGQLDKNWQTNLAIKSLNKGMYFIQIENEKGWMPFTFIKE
ncbi:MAG: carboxylesterase family protein [Chitinophagaceae bacterium]